MVEEKQVEKQEEKQEKSSGLTTRKIKVLVSIVYGNLFMGSCYALMAPFFPAEAEHKGATATEYGFIMGVYQLIIFLTAVMYGHLLPRIGPSFMLKTGITVSGVCVILFGSLYYVPSGPTFLVLAFLIRFIDALGASAFFTASYAIVGGEFSHMIGRAMSIVETAFSVGLTVGPALGGFLYALGNFKTPFFVIGGLLLTGALTTFLLLPNDGYNVTSGEKRPNAFKLLRNPDFMLDILTMVLCLTTVGFNEATLEPHLRSFHLTSEMLGGIFLVSGLVDAVSSYLWGYVSEKVPNASLLIALSSVFMILCYLLIGPVPFLPFGTTLWVVILCQVFLGMGMGGEIVCCFTHGIKNALERGFPDEASTYGLVSSFLLSASCFGGFAGPAIGGLVLDHIGYENGTIYIAALQVLLAVLILLRLFCTRKTKTKIMDEKLSIPA